MKTAPFRRTRLLAQLLETLLEKRSTIWALITFALMISSAVAFSIAPLALGRWVEQVGDGTKAPFGFSFVAYLVLYGLGFAARDLQWAAFGRFERGVHTRLASLLFKNAVGGTKAESEGEFGVGNVSTTLQGVQAFLFCVGFIIVPFGLETIGMLLSISGSISWRVGASFGVFILGFLIILNWSTEKISVHNRKLVRTGNAMFDLFAKLFEQRGLLQRHQAIGFGDAILGASVEAREIERVRVGDCRSRTTIVLNAWIVLSLFGTLALAIQLARSGQIRAGEVVAIEVFFFQIMRRLEVWARGYRDSAMSADQCEVLLKWLHRDGAERLAPSAESPRISLVPVEVGKWNTIIGSTGVGKSTFLRIRQEQQGSSSVMVSQHGESLPASVRDNLLLGKSVPDARIHDVLLGVGLDGVVRRLSQGLETVLGQNGAPLSGGELQRLCVARAILHQAREILLDEPTSAQSEAQEAALLAFLRTESGSRTIVTVSHRPAAVGIADVVWSIDGWNQCRRMTHDS